MIERKTLLAVLLTVCTLVGCLALSACGKKSITIAEIDAACRTDSLLKTYASFQTSVVYAEDNAVVTQYVDKDMIYALYPDWAGLYLDSTLRYIAFGDTLAGALVVQQEPIIHEARDNIVFSIADTETIKSCEEKDGKLYVTTELSAEQSVELVAKDGYTCGAGEHLRVEYVLDAKTSTVLSNKTFLVAEDGAKRDYCTFTVEYNAAKPEQAQAMYELATATENLRTLTIITDPDTASEQSFSIRLPKGDAVQPYPAEGYQTMFTDRACTEPLTTAVDRNTDCTLYMKKGQ